MVYVYHMKFPVPRTKQIISNKFTAYCPSSVVKEVLSAYQHFSVTVAKLLAALSAKLTNATLPILICDISIKSVLSVVIPSLFPCLISLGK